MDRREAKPMSSHERAATNRRDRETRRAETLNDDMKYFHNMDSQTAQFDEWTSPRYYKDNNKLIRDLKDKREGSNHSADDTDATSHVVKENEDYNQQAEWMEKDISKEEQLKHQTHQLGVALQAQMDEITLRVEVAKQLRITEAKALGRRIAAADLKDQWAREEKVRVEREIVLFNMKQHRRKLEEKSKQVKEELRRDQAFVEQIKRADLLAGIEDEEKRQALTATMDKFNTLVSDLHEIEERRKPHIERAGEAEAEPVFEKFNEAWTEEKIMREALIKEVVHGIHDQIHHSVEKSKKKRQDLMAGKEELLQKAEECRKEMSKLKVAKQEK